MIRPRSSIRSIKEKPVQLIALAASAALLVLLAASAQARTGARAASFGEPGQVTTTFGPKSDDVAQALVVQANGKILAVGYRAGDVSSNVALARYDRDGTLDRTFGINGQVTTDLGSAAGNAAALRPDGRIVVGGQILVSPGDYDFLVVRFTSNGSTLDNNFGQGGTVTTSFGSTGDFVNALALQPDGKIVAAGTSGDRELRNGVFALARYDADGALDRSFGDGGKVTTSFSSPGDDAADAVAVQPDGKIVAAGSNFVAAREGSSDFAVARYRADGSLDPTFGTGGKVTTSFGTGSDFGNALVLQPDGKIVVAGYTYIGGAAGRSYFALARYTSDGKLDPGFGTGGRVTTDLGAGGGTAWAVTLQPDGKILAAGSAQAGSFGLARYETDGSLDPSFGSGGTVTTPVGLVDEGQANVVAVRPGGSIVAAGWGITCTFQDFTLAGYQPNGSVDSSFGSGSTRCTVPNVKGKTLAAAKRAIARRNCIVGPIGRSFSRTVPRGRVIGQFPSARTKCLPGLKVTLSVSKGKPKGH